jgi:hypothetical protein
MPLKFNNAVIQGTMSYFDPILTTQVKCKDGLIRLVNYIERHIDNYLDNQTKEYLSPYQHLEKIDQPTCYSYVPPTSLITIIVLDKLLIMPFDITCDWDNEKIEAFVTEHVTEFTPVYFDIIQFNEEVMSELRLMSGGRWLLYAPNEQFISPFENELCNENAQRFLDFWTKYDFSTFKFPSDIANVSNREMPLDEKEIFSLRIFKFNQDNLKLPSHIKPIKESDEDFFLFVGFQKFWQFFEDYHLHDLRYIS